MAPVGLLVKLSRQGQRLAFTKRLLPGVGLFPDALGSLRALGDRDQFVGPALTQVLALELQEHAELAEVLAGPDAGLGLDPSPCGDRQARAE